MTLVDVRVGDVVKVVNRAGGRGLESGLTALGIHVGDEVVVKRAAPFRGPILVHVPSSGISVAVGRGMAGKVVVEPVV